MRMRPSAVTICLMASAAPWILPSTVGAVESDAPNILVVLVDALRADRLGAYGHRGHLTPAIDTFAREGVVFERAIAAAPWTLPSVASLFTSVYPSVHGVFGAERDATGPNPDRGWEGFVLADAFDTLAERLQRAGYQTAAFSANPLVVRKKRRPTWSTAPCSTGSMPSATRRGRSSSTRTIWTSTVPITRSRGFLSR
jgi:arylsulfatase A-like enzyme